MTSRPILVGAVLACAGCLDDGASFVCNSDSACEGGVCIAHGCAHLDAACPMGFRWDSSAGPRAGSCAEIPDMAASLTDMTDPNCGNGVLDPGELCDDGPGSPQPCPTGARACDDGEACTTDLVEGAGCQRQCLHSYDGLDDGKPCPVPDGGAAGLCYQHQCCRGCWDPAGGRCNAGSAGTVCGHAGLTCTDCTATGLDAGTPECLVNSCNLMHQCAHDFVTDGTSCAGGTGACFRGQCCTGCVDGNGQCQSGDSDPSCGSGGNSCASCTCVNRICTNCPHAQNCLGKQCGSDGCGSTCGTCDTDPTQPKLCDMSGKCVCANNVENSDQLCGDKLDDDCNGKIDCADGACDLKRCGAQPGSFCNLGACATGCRIGGKFYGKGSVNPMNSCQHCDPIADEENWADQPGGTTCGPPNQCKNGCKSCLGLVPCEAGPTCMGGVCGAGAPFEGTCCAGGCSNNNGVINCAL